MFKDMDFNFETRDFAMLVYNNKIYIACNHQEAILLAYKDNKIEIIDGCSLSELTYKLNVDTEIACLEIFESLCRCIIAYSKDSLFKYINVISEYAKQNNYKIGYYNYENLKYNTVIEYEF